MFHWVLSVIFIIGGLVIGLVIEKIVFTILKKFFHQTKWEGNKVVLSTLRGVITLLFLIAGIYSAVLTLKISPNLSNILQKILSVGTIFLVTLVLSRLAVGFVNLYLKKTEGVLPSTSLFANLTKLLIFTLGFLIILNKLGISVTPILTALGVGGLAVALALKDTLSNFFSGFQIIVSKQIRPGDYVKLDSGEEGFITDINWRNTIIRALSNNITVVPNSKLAQSSITNYYLPQKELAVLIEIVVSYDSDLEKVERVTIDVAQEVIRGVPGCILETKPFIRYHTFADYGIKFTVILRAQEFVDQYLIKHEFIKRLHKRYKDEGIKIPSPFIYR